MQSGLDVGLGDQLRIQNCELKLHALEGTDVRQTQNYPSSENVSQRGGAQ